MDIPALLDAAKKAQGFETDMALAKALGVSRSAVSAWRNGAKGPDPVQSAALAGYTGIPLAKVLGIVGEARAISAKEKAVWRRLAATATLLALGVLGSLPAPAHAATSGFDAPHSVHYAKLSLGMDPPGLQPPPQRFAVQSPMAPPSVVRHHPPGAVTRGRA